MPWKETSPVDERERFVLECLRGNVAKSRLCAKYGIARKTGYKWLERFLEGGRRALLDQSRRPTRHPNRTPEEVEERIVSLRKAHPTWGPKKLQVLLRDGGIRAPATSTIGKILADRELVVRRTLRRRPASRAVHLTEPEAPNDLWAADFKGQFRMGNGCYNYPLTVSDGVSRYLLGCQGLESTALAEAKATFEALFEVFGLPDRIRTDNGTPFSSAGIAGLSKLSVWWLKLGVWPELTRRASPQDNGRHERMHRTLKAEATRPPGRNMVEQQTLFDAFVHEYNEVRPHEALAMKTPAAMYRRSIRRYTGTPERFEYPIRMETRKVSGSGSFKWKNQVVFLSSVLSGEQVGFEEIDDGLWEVHVGPLVAAHFDQRSGRATTALAGAQATVPASSSEREEAE